MHCIVNADQNNNAHQYQEQLVHGTAAHPLVQRAAGNAAADAAGNHQNQGGQGELRHAVGDKGGQQAGDLAEQNDVQTVLRCGLGFHAEKVEQHNQIDGAAANAQKAGHQPQHQANDNAECQVGNMLALDARLEQGVHKSANGDNGQADRLYHANRVGVGEHARNGAEQLFAHNAAHCGTNGQRGAGAEIHPVIASGNVFAHGVAAHGKHGAPRKKTDGCHAGKAQHIQHRLDDNTAANAADRPRNGRKKTDTEKQD